MQRREDMCESLPKRQPAEAVRGFPYPLAVAGAASTSSAVFETISDGVELIFRLLEPARGPGDRRPECLSDAL